ncbi:MAG: isochorismatase family protein [Synergistaceae bacterium]|jgi:nicotinamidase-related amidase|nr:isochorismatase family protein [Synergistaceae bacterium]
MDPIKTASETQRGALIIIDPQNDFCDQRGSLYVDGAASDIERLARHIRNAGENIDYAGIFVSLDSHDRVAIFHPRFWMSGSGAPDPYASITVGDFESRKFRVASPGNEEYAARMFSVMKRKGVDSMMIWPEHCIVSTWGHQIADELRDALAEWRRRTGLAVRYVFKGENPYTDQFSIFEGLDDTWPETAFNKTLLERLAAFDSVTFAGEALSHCVESSILSYVTGLGEKKQPLLLLADCTSSVASFDRGVSIDRLAAVGVAFASAG